MNQKGNMILLEPSEAKKAPKRFKVMQKADGQKYRIIPKTVYYQGTAFTLDEEVAVDSDETNSVETSDDDFTCNDEEVISKVNIRI